MTTADKIRAAMAFVPADERATWIHIGMALHAELSDEGREIWDSWSQQSDKYSAAESEAQWRSFRAGGGITIGTLFHTAIQHGWTPDGEYQAPDPAEKARRRLRQAAIDAEEAKRKARRHAAATKVAERIISECRTEQHAYFDQKGLGDHRPLVHPDGRALLDSLQMDWQPDGDNLICVPMRFGGKITSVQMIDRTGTKKFLPGGQAARAEFVIDAGGQEWFVEGMATGLSLARCLAAVSLRYRIHVCFSDSNLVKLATGRHGAFIAADNDASGAGEAAARKAGLPYWMGLAGEDVNNAHQRMGALALGFELAGWVRNHKRS